MGSILTEFQVEGVMFMVGGVEVGCKRENGEFAG